MPTYRYTARDRQGRKTHGTAQAASPGALYAHMRGEGLFVIWEKEKDSAVGKPLKTDRLAEFCHSLGALLAAGIPLARALDTLQADAGLDARLRRISGALGDELRQGAALSDAMETLAPAFPPPLVAMLRSGEAAGSLDACLARSALHYRKTVRLERTLSANLAYPTLLAALTAAVTAVLMLFVVPRFSALFGQLERLPAATALLLGVSEAARRTWPGLCLLAAAFFVLTRRLRVVPAVRLRWDLLRLRMPLTGSLTRKACTARFARTLADLYAGGLPVLPALDAARSASGNAWLDIQLAQAAGMVRAGVTLSAALREIDGLEPRLAASVAVGEETGRLGDMLTSVGDAMDAEAEAAAKKMIALAEPVMIVLLAMVVGFVIVAVMLPLYRSYGTIGAA